MTDLAKLRMLLADPNADEWPHRALFTAWDALPALLDELEALRRDAVPVREGWWDKALAERDAWRQATGCDTPEEARGLDRTREEALTAHRIAREGDLAELARLRELEAAVLDREDGLVVDSRRLPAAIAACRAAKEGT